MSYRQMFLAPIGDTDPPPIVVIDLTETWIWQNEDPHIWLNDDSSSFQGQNGGN